MVAIVQFQISKRVMSFDVSSVFRAFHKLSIKGNYGCVFIILYHLHGLSLHNNGSRHRAIRNENSKRGHNQGDKNGRWLTCIITINPYGDKAK